jgi:twinkle protein
MNQFILEKDVIDFALYEKESEVKQTMKPADLYVRALIDEIHNPVPSNHRYMPWLKSHDLIQFRPGEVTIWGGENGGGKSLITGQVALSLADQGEKCCIASFEMKPRKTMGRMGRQFTGFAHNDALFNSDPRQRDAVISSYEEFEQWTKGKLWLYNKQGTVNWQNVVAMCKYAARELGCTQIFVDNLGKCVQGEDDYNGQKEFIDKICAIARDEDIHIHVVHHVKKPATEGARGNKYSFKGTGAITDQPDNVIVVWRNKAKEHDRTGKLKDEADTILIVDKQRNGEGKEGDLWLWYRPESQQFVDSQLGDMMRFA